MLPAFALSSPTATLIGPSAVSNPRNEAAADRAHVFGFVLFVHCRLCRCDFVLARRQVRRRPFGPSTEISDPVRCWRGDSAQIAALRSCAVLAKRESVDIAYPAPSLNPTKLSIRPSLRPKIHRRWTWEGMPWTTTRAF